MHTQPNRYIQTYFIVQGMLCLIYIMRPYPETLQFVFPRISTLQIVSVNKFCKSLDHNTIKYNIFDEEIIPHTN